MTSSQARAAQRTPPRLGPGHYDIGVCIASAVVHLIIGSGYWDDVNQAADVRDPPVSPARKHPYCRDEVRHPET